MGSIRSKLTINPKLEKLGLSYATVYLGEIDMRDNSVIEQQDAKTVQQPAHEQLAELTADRKWQLIERIKQIIVELLHDTDEMPRLKNSEYISSKLNHSYTYLANVFSETMGVTIEQYIIVHKIERVKKLLVGDDMSLTEISYRLSYSSVAHLSYQFKKVTGLTPSYFKKLSGKRMMQEMPVNYISTTA